MRQSALPGHIRRHTAIVALCFLLTSQAVLPLGLQEASTDVHGSEDRPAHTKQDPKPSNETAESTPERSERPQAVQDLAVQGLAATQQGPTAAAASNRAGICEAAEEHHKKEQCLADLTFRAAFHHLLRAGVQDEGDLLHGGLAGLELHKQQAAGDTQRSEPGSKVADAELPVPGADSSSPHVPGTADVPPVAEQRAPESAPEATAAVEAEEDEDRHNFALAKDGAKVVAANKEARKAAAVLDSDADTFLKNECKADKWVIIELSQLAKMDTLVLSQYELYSSRIKDFTVRGRQTHPRSEGSDYARTLNSTGWQLLGNFTAENIKGSQAFKFEHPAWLKFLQIHMLTHYGSEAVCALNDVCVYGKSAAEDIEAQLTLEVDRELLQAEPPNTAELPPAVLPVVLPAALPVVIPATTIDSEKGQAGSPVRPAVGNLTPSLDQEGPAKAQEHIAALESPVMASEQEQQALQGNAAGASAPVQEAANASAPPAIIPAAAEAAKTKSEGGDSKAEPVKEPLVEARDPAVLLDSTPESFAAVAEELLPANSASSAAARHGGSVYDLLELKAIKLSQKSSSRTLTEFQRNVTAAIRGLAMEMDSLSARMALSASRAALPVSDTTSCQSGNGENATRAGQEAFSRLGLDKRKAQGYQDTDDQDAELKVIQPLSEAESLQQELGKFREEIAALTKAVRSSKRKVDGILMALALVGGTGAVFAMHAGPSQRLLKGLLLVFASLQVGLILAQARGKLTFYLLG